MHFCLYCQVLSQLQVKLSLKAKLALFSYPPAGWSAGHPSRKVVIKVVIYMSIVGRKLEENLNFWAKIEDDLNI